MIHRWPLLTLTTNNHSRGKKIMNDKPISNQPPLSGQTPNPHLGGIKKGKNVSFTADYGSINQIRLKQVEEGDSGFRKNVFLPSRENSTISQGGDFPSKVVISKGDSDEGERQALLEKQRNVIKDQGKEDETPEQGVQRIDSVFPQRPKKDRDGNLFETHPIRYNSRFLPDNSTDTCCPPNCQIN